MPFVLFFLASEGLKLMIGSTRLSSMGLGSWRQHSSGSQPAPETPLSHYKGWLHSAPPACKEDAIEPSGKSGNRKAPKPESP